MSTPAPTCVLLADRHHGLTEGVRGLLETAFETVVMVADEVSLLEGAARLRPDVVIVDVSLAQRSGLDWLRELRARCPGVKVIALSVHDEDSVRDAALRAGADGFVLKRAIATDLLPAVEAARRRPTCTTPDDRRPPAAEDAASPPIDRGEDGGS